MNRPSIVVSCPIDTYSGYGARGRDFVKSLVDLDKYDVKILAQRWGETRWGYLKDHNDTVFTPLIVNNLTQQPDIWIQISIPNEFQKVGKYNIGVTAGIETTLCDPSWIKGANNMDLILVSSNHALESLNRSKFDIKDDKTGQIKEKLDLKTKVEILFEGADLTKYFPANYTKDLDNELISLKTALDSIPESFCFMTTGHWMQGDFGEDRKNIGFTIKSFLETFKNKPNAPALIMKSHCMTTSIMDRDRMLEKIDAVRKSAKGKLPNIYLLHGEVSDKGMNVLYNHPKVKAFISLPKGEGFGRPFLEFSLVNKPIIASSWSGQTDFLDREFVRFVKGDLKNVDKSAAVKNILLTESQWFSPDPIDVGKAYKEIYKDYKKWTVNAKRQGHKSRTEFSYEAMVTKLDKILIENIPEFPKQVELSLPKLNLPKLKKVGEETEAPKIQLPKLKKL
jgi:glycosyltransferase involved in cell wall biosynthesis